MLGIKFHVVSSFGKRRLLTTSAWSYSDLPLTVWPQYTTRGPVMKAIIFPVLVFGCLGGAPPPDHALKPETVAAFHRYEALTEQRIAKQVGDPAVFLYVNTLLPAERDRVFASLKQGEIYIAPLTTLDADGRTIEVPQGLIHHWIGAAFMPGVSLQETLQVVEDYDHKQDDYPEVERSRLIRRDGDDIQAFMRLHQRHLITVTLDVEFDIRYIERDPHHWYVRSHSTRVRQVENAGKADERDLPEGQGDGFLWQLDSYWRYVEQDGGVYVELEAVSLTRDVPTGLGWMIKPFLTSIPRESLESTLESTRKAVLKRH
jgi:hypothetical protein